MPQQYQYVHQVMMLVESTWGSTTHVGLTEIELFDASNSPIALANSQVPCLPLPAVFLDMLPRGMPHHARFLYGRRRGSLLASAHGWSTARLRLLLSATCGLHRCRLHR